MANNFFKFRQFTIFQDHCAMKVCTDACLFGAYVANEISEKKLNAGTCLDIGTGTGLLALMVAQKNSLPVDAVEIDDGAFLQAKENIRQSVFSHQVSVYHSDILEFKPEKKYDLIISNPPFYEHDLLSENHLKNTAKHSAALTLEKLLLVVNNLLSKPGIFSILLPHHRLDYFEKIALEQGLYLLKKY